MPLGKVVLEIEALGTTGVFELQKDREYTTDLERNFLLGGRGQTANELFDWVSDSDVDPRRGWYLDLGVGTIPIDIEAELSETPVRDHDADTETHLQMGDSDDPNTLTKTSATGAHPVTQAQVFHRYCVNARTDSETPVELHIGEWHDGTYAADGQAGLFETPLEVAITQGPRFTASSDESATVEVSMSVVVVSGLGLALDAIQNDER